MCPESEGNCSVGVEPALPEDVTKNWCRMSITLGGYAGSVPADDVTHWGVLRTARGLGKASCATWRRAASTNSIKGG